MKFYEPNSPRNEIGRLGLLCPHCGNAALARIERKAGLRIMKVGDGIIIKLQKDVNPITGDDILKCPQCDMQMQTMDDVREIHDKYYKCPGCVVCGNIYEDIFQVCKDCIMQYRDVLTPCDNCPYNYSRIQRGIDIVAMKEYFDIEYAPIEGQAELFPMSVVIRRSYSNQYGKVGCGNAW